MTKPLSAVIFDLDGVITDTAEYHYLAWKALAEDLHIPFPKAFNEQLKGISRMASLEKILENGGRGQDFTETEKISLTDQKNEHYLSLIKQISPEDILPGIDQLLQDIKASELKIGLASASKNAFMVVQALGVKQYFDVIVDVTKIKCGKPDPEIFLKAAELLQVSPPECIGIEDALAGVEAIKGAGMFAVAIGAAEQFNLADLVFEQTADMTFAQIRSSFQKFT